MVLMGQEKGQLINVAVELAKINHTPQLGVDCDYLMSQLKIASEFKKKGEKWLDDEFSDKKKELRADETLADTVPIPCVCALCGTKISEKVRDYSIKAFQITLCFKCQKNRAVPETKKEG